MFVLDSALFEAATDGTDRLRYVATNDIEPVVNSAAGRLPSMRRTVRLGEWASWKSSQKGNNASLPLEFGHLHSSRHPDLRNNPDTLNTGE